MRTRDAGIAAALLESLRPKAWLKNLFLFAGMIFARLWSLDALWRTALGALGFSLLAGAVYLLNDVADRERDRVHPEKKSRPVASGRLPAGWAVAWAVLLASGVLVAAGFLSPRFAIVCAIYLVLQLAYSLRLKHVPILDSLLIAMGFVLRALAGVELAMDAGFSVTISPWLLLCTFFVAVFLAFTKRRAEVVALGESAESHRSILREYSPHLLDEMIGISTASSLMCYAIYTVSERTLGQVSAYLWITVPFVAFGIFRYLYLVHMKGLGGSPERVLLSDPPLMVNILLWLACVMLVLRLLPA
jgi:4-hydroxybenzoate polyprenyltransferase